MNEQTSAYSETTREEELAQQSQGILFQEDFYRALNLEFRRDISTLCSYEHPVSLDANGLKATFTNGTNLDRILELFSKNPNARANASYRFGLIGGPAEAIYVEIATIPTQGGTFL